MQVKKAHWGSPHRLNAQDARPRSVPQYSISAGPCLCHRVRACRRIQRQSCPRDRPGAARRTAVWLELVSTLATDIGDHVIKIVEHDVLPQRDEEISTVTDFLRRASPSLRNGDALRNRFCLLIQAVLIQQLEKQTCHLVVVHVGEGICVLPQQPRILTKLQDFGVAAIIVDNLGAQAGLDNVMIRLGPIVAPDELDLLEFR